MGKINKWVQVFLILSNMMPIDDVYVEEIA